MAPAAPLEESDFPCTLTVRVPFPTPRLASVALRTLAVDEELSPLVRRSLSLETSLTSDAAQSPLKVSSRTGGALIDADPTSHEQENVLKCEYRATTNRMLRVAVNGFFESIGLLISAMRQLDVDVAGKEWVGGGEEGEDVDNLVKVQGLTEMGAL